MWINIIVLRVFNRNFYSLKMFMFICQTKYRVVVILNPYFIKKKHFDVYNIRGQPVWGFHIKYLKYIFLLNLNSKRPFESFIQITVSRIRRKIWLLHHVGDRGIKHLRRVNVYNTILVFHLSRYNILLWYTTG